MDRENQKGIKKVMDLNEYTPIDGFSEEEYPCIICGKRLSISSEESRCIFCGKTEKADYICQDGHYICEECRLATAEEIIRKTCESTLEKDPLEIAVLLMRHPAISMHGPENHLLTAYSILTALRNTGYQSIGKREFERVKVRLKKASQGICGSWGVCGCAIAAGAVTSVITGANYLSDRERSLALKISSKILDEIAQIGGPRCCKASTFSAIKMAVEFFNHELGIPISISKEIKPCVFSKSNMECLKGRCPYYDGKDMEKPSI